MSEMIERVAKAIAVAHQDEMMRQYADQNPIRMEWDDVGAEKFRAEILILARAAIAAMREPTEAMVREGEAEIFESLAGARDWSLENTAEGWRAMIDEALK